MMAGFNPGMNLHGDPGAFNPLNILFPVDVLLIISPVLVASLAFMAKVMVWFIPNVPPGAVYLTYGSC